MRMHIATLVFLCQSLSAFAQLPNTNLYLFKMEQINDSLFNFSRPQTLTAFNIKGYNNQPSFFSDNEIYLTVQTTDDTSQTEIYALNLLTKTKKRITATPEAEYSPTLMPDKFHFSAIRVEEDNSQRLWKFPIDRRSGGEPLLTQFKNIGYHYWLNENDIILFLVGEPHEMVIADLETGKTYKLATDIGRCFQQFPNGHLAYVHKLSDDTWFIRDLNYVTRESGNIVKTLPGSEDFVVLPDGTILMAKGSRLYKFHPAYDKNWLMIKDFLPYGINNITRMAVSHDKKLVLVSP